MFDRSYYLRLRKRYEPEQPQIIFVAESPPVSGKYFYDPSGLQTEPLFAAMMQCVLSSSPSSKEDGLRAFQARCHVLVDATYRPVDKGVPDGERQNIILRDYHLLRDDLLGLTPEQNIPLILIKKNICVLLEPKLIADGFQVINRGVIIPFPVHWHRKVFQTRVMELVQSGE